MSAMVAPLRMKHSIRNPIEKQHGMEKDYVCENGKK